MVGETGDDLRAAPREKVGDEPGAESPGGLHPLVLEVVEPAREAGLVRCGGVDCGAVLIAVAGEPAEVVAEEMAA